MDTKSKFPHLNRLRQIGNRADRLYNDSERIFQLFWEKVHSVRQSAVEADIEELTLLYQKYKATCDRIEEENLKYLKLIDTICERTEEEFFIEADESSTETDEYIMPEMEMRREAPSVAPFSGKKEFNRLKEMTNELKQMQEDFGSMSYRSCIQLREMKAVINQMLAQSQLNAEKRKIERQATKEQERRELEEAKRNIY